MITVRFFASIRERAGTEQIAIDPPDTDLTAADAVTHALNLLGRHDIGLPRLKILYVVNREMRDASWPVVDGDEVAALPPLSGGY